MITTHTDIVQGSPEWTNLRKGYFGGTTAYLFLQDGKKHPLSDALRKKIYEKVADRYGLESSDSWVSDAMLRGIELEPVARIEYEIETRNQVQEVGYISNGPWVGVSPDGLVGDDGIIEIKCPMGTEYMRFLHTGVIQVKHVAQMQWGMWITGRAWCAYIVYHPGQKLLIQRVKADLETFEQFKTKWFEAEKIIKELELKFE